MMDTPYKIEEFEYHDVYHSQVDYIFFKLFIFLRD